jgi:TQXA domain-containing protein
MLIRPSRSAAAGRRFVIAGAAVAIAVMPMLGGAAAASAAGPSPHDGGTVYVGSRQGYSGTGVFPVYAQAPADPANPGTPDLWAYCIEHGAHAETGIEGVVGDPGSYLGANYFTDPAVRSRVMWVLAHSYPALSLQDFGAAAGVPGIARDDALEATQYAIWRYTELTYDAPWAFADADSATAYSYLLAGANASTGTTPDTAHVSISAPSTSQAGTLVGPFTVTTDRPTVTVSVAPATPLTDASGIPIDPNAVTDGQGLYLDLRGSTTAGTATITATVAGSAVNGHIVSVPTAPGATPTAADHAQSIILVASGTATTSVQAVARWTGTVSSAGAPAAGVPTLPATGVEAAGGLGLGAAALGAGAVLATLATLRRRPGIRGR